MNGGPLRMMTLALTGECNLRCRYCYQNAKSGAPMRWSVVEAATGRLLESTSGQVELVFAGGEPLLALPLIERAVRLAERRRPARLGVRYGLATNGTLLRPDVIAFLDRHQFEIELSFDGVLPAQAVRGKHSFAQIDAALGDLCTRACGVFWQRLSVGVTLDAGAVPYLAESFSYFLDKRIPSISVSPAAGQSARWTPRVIKTLERQLGAVYAASLRRYEDTGEVPLALFRKTRGQAQNGKRPICGAADPASVTIDVDGQAYACPMLAESCQQFANPRLAAALRPMRIGGVAEPAFWSRLAQLPAAARAAGIFHVGPRRHSLHGLCIQCCYRRSCKACPVAVLSEPEHEDALRIPDYLCAFNWILLGLRDRFPVQPDADDRLAGRAPLPRLVREFLRDAEVATD